MNFFRTWKPLKETEDMDFRTAPCDWTEKDAEYVAEYDVLRKLGMKNVKKLDIRE